MFRRQDRRDTASHRRQDRGDEGREVHKDAAEVWRRHQHGHGQRANTAAHRGRERKPGHHEAAGGEN